MVLSLHSFCRKLAAACAFSYTAWLCLLPNVIINATSGNTSGPW
jgi:hypothetical protein